jgi:hypothetical protein
MAQKIVTAKIDPKARTVTLTGEPGLMFPMSFHVQGGDTLKWRLVDVPAGSAARIRFVESPGPTPLLKRGNTVDGNDAEIDGGGVDPNAPDGHYSHDFFLLTAKGEDKLRCVWSDGTTTKPTPQDRAPGKKSGGP